MGQESFLVALEYLVELNLFLYYPTVLPNVVFFNSQVLLDKITELVQLNRQLRGNRFASSQIGRGGEWLPFREHGMVTVEFLKEFQNHYRTGLFEPQDLLKLLTSLQITSKLASGECIMPCLLSELLPDEVDSYRNREFPSHASEPLLIEYPEKWVPAGVFTLLVALLPNKAHWKVLCRHGKPLCFHRNCVRFNVPGGSHRGKVTLIDSFQYLEVHLDSPSTCPEVCSRICRDIFFGLEQAASALGYGILEPMKSFFCLRRGQACEATLHSACIGEGEWICNINSDVGGQLTREHRMWLNGECTS